MAFLGALPQEVSLAILARLNPLSIKKLCAASTDARAAASQCITSVEWSQHGGEDPPPPLADLSAAFPAATSLKLRAGWPSIEDAVAWLHANHQLLARLQALELRFWSQIDATTRSLQDAVVLYASQCTALRSLDLTAGSSPLHALASLTNLTSLDLWASAAYRNVVQTLRKLPGLQRLLCRSDISIEGEDLSLTSQLAALTSLGIEEVVAARCGALAAAAGLRELIVSFVCEEDEDEEDEEADYWEGSEGLSRLTQLSSLRVMHALGEDIPHHLSALVGLSSLDVECAGMRKGSLTALAGLLRGLDSLRCGNLGSEEMDPSLLHSIGCASLTVATLHANCQLVSAEAPPLPHLRSLQLLWAGPLDCPLVLHLSGLTSLNIGWESGSGISDDECSQLVDRLPLLRVLQLYAVHQNRSPAAPSQLTLDGLRHLSRLQQLQQLCLVSPQLPPPSYAVLAQCSALRRLLLDCDAAFSKLSGAALEACLDSMACWRQLRHVVLLSEGPTSVSEAVQEVCDRVVGAALRHELVMEVKRWGRDQAWAYMLEHAV
jgi:hypothetical protein